MYYIDGGTGRRAFVLGVRPVQIAGDSLAVVLPARGTPPGGTFNLTDVQG